MKKLLILLLTIFSIQSFSQSYEEKYERYVGYKDDSYPLTLDGLESAILSLSDSGVIHIAYPGIDTTGLGIVPDNIHLEGWVQSQYISTLNTVLCVLVKNAGDSDLFLLDQPSSIINIDSVQVESKDSTIQFNMYYSDSWNSLGVMVFSDYQSITVKQTISTFDEDIIPKNKYWFLQIGNVVGNYGEELFLKIFYR